MSELTMPEKLEHENSTIEFLNDKQPDTRGRFVHEYLVMSEKEMEDCHDWIQHAFPIDTISPHNPAAPLYFGIMKYNHRTLETQTKLTEKYLNSIGLYIDTKFDQYNNPTIYVRVNEAKFYSVVSHPNNHHIKRITRLLKHLTSSQRNSWLARAIYIALVKTQWTFPLVEFHSRTIVMWSAAVLDFNPLED